MKSFPFRGHLRSASYGRALSTALVTALALSACGSDPAPPAFTFQINSRDVVLTAVDRIEIVLEPQSLDQNFTTVPDRSLYGGNVFTRVSAAGEFVINVERPYIAEHGHTAPDAAFIMELPLYSTDATDDPVVAVPQARTTFIRGAERIAVGSRFLEWPLPAGGRAVATVSCIRTPMNFGPQCTNNDPVRLPDAGPSGADGG